LNITNFRDLGGIINKDGKKVVSMRLFRSAELSRLSDSCTLALKNEYNLTTIIDFRSSYEINQRPNISVENSRYINIDILDGIAIDYIGYGDERLTGPLARKHMNIFYHSFLKASPKYSHFFKEVLANKEGALLFHCVHGKDRTGFGAALLLKALDVEDKVIFRDYMKTRSSRKEENLKTLEEYKNQGYTQAQINGIEVLLSVDKLYLKSLFDTINKEFGSFHNYLAQELHITPKEINQLKAMYLE